jgi:hypothetical protein
VCLEIDASTEVSFGEGAELTRIWSKPEQIFLCVATFSLRVQNRPGRRITARLVFARPPYADAPLWNAEECRGRIVVVARGPRSGKIYITGGSRTDIEWEHFKRWRMVIFR